MSKKAKANRSRNKKSTKKIVIAKEIRKRDGSLAPFDAQKIKQAISSAMASLGIEDDDKASDYTAGVVVELAKRLTPKEIPTVEGVQDIVEKTLIEAGDVRLARAYITYRADRATIRKEKEQILEKDAIDEVDKTFDINALKVLRSRYLKKNAEGKLEEGPKDLFMRVALYTYIPSLLYDKRLFDKSAKSPKHETPKTPSQKEARGASIGPYKLNKHHIKGLMIAYQRLNREKKMRYSWSQTWKKIMQGNFDDHIAGINAFYDMMRNKQFLPNTPTLANFGRSLGMGSACFVLDIEDSMESIMSTLKNAAFIFKAGGGVGYNFSKLRPENAPVKSTSGTASGPISFMRLFDGMTEVIKQGGIRRGANMGLLNSSHPDIEKFISAKAGNLGLKNFNISVLLMGDFWKHYHDNSEYPLEDPRSGKVVRRINARALFDRIVYQAWESAEPGLIFHDNANDRNPFLKSLGPIISTNPCGEVLLYPNESCNLGSINAHAFIKRSNGHAPEFDWDGFSQTIGLATEFLDNIIDVNHFPLPEIEEMTRNTRKIGLGVMGVADCLFALRIPYDSNEGLAFMEKLMETINYWSKVASIDMARKRGPFPYFKKSFYPEGKLPVAKTRRKGSQFNWKEIAKKASSGIRNAYTTVIAPTGSISMIAGTSSGIEPVFSLVYEKNVAVGNFYYIDEEFERVMREFGIYDEALLKEISDERGSLSGISYIPRTIKKVFRVAHDLQPEAHIRAMATFQKWVDSSISKTINFPTSATPEDMKKAYLLAHELGCKGVTVYRDGSIEGQVLSSPQKDSSTKKSNGKKIDAGKDIKVCPKCSSSVVRAEGCIKCPACGWGLCI